MSLLALARQARDVATGSDELVSPLILRSLLSAVHFRDKETVLHMRRVALVAVGIAQELGWEAGDVRLLEIASLLHDVGKIGVPDSILHKPAKLCPDETEVVALNHNVGLTILQACLVDHRVIEIMARAARVDWGVSVGGPESPMIAHAGRILAVADVYDSLSHDQVYRKHLSQDDVVKALVESDRQLDRNVISALRRWLESGGVSALDNQKQAEASISVSAPIDKATIAQSNSMCHAFAYLYLLESLYDGYYVVDPDLKLVICNRGVMGMFPKAKFLPGEVWSRRMIRAIDESGEGLDDAVYPLRCAFETRRAQCAVLKVTKPDGQLAEIEFHAIPLIDPAGRLVGAAEILRDVAKSKRNTPLYTELRQAANQDSLTGIANRGQLETKLEDLFTEYNRSGGKDPFSVIFIDIDHFKRINDTLNHAMGDEVLVGLVRLLEDELYSGETLGRYGGEEFLILCPATTVERAVKRAERLRRIVQSSRLTSDADLVITASFGVAQLAAGDSIDTVVDRADQALFDAKRGGRNRTCFRQPEDHTAPNTGYEAVAESHEHDEFVHTADFVVREAADLVIYKLKGFVEDHDARLLDVQKEVVGMQIGRKSMFSRWGESSSRQPVDVVITMTKAEENRRAMARKMTLQVTVTPIGVPKDSEVFHERAARVVELLRSHLVAD